MDPLKRAGLMLAIELFRKKYLKAVLDWEEDPNIRARWTKEEVMDICRWPYLRDWRTLRNALENQVGLILLLPGAQSAWGGNKRCWTFPTRKADMMWGVQQDLKQLKGTAYRTRETVRKRIAPRDGRYALESKWVSELLDNLDENVNTMKLLADGARRDWELEAAVEAYEDYGEQYE